jgi:uncharacterized protein YdhG (YjbR/CyaY superfamily)
MAGKPKIIDEYLTALSDDKRAALEKLRKIIRAAAPKAEECISYQLPAFRLNGGKLVATIPSHTFYMRGEWRTMANLNTRERDLL